jgi:hypothetical protein
MSALPLTTTTHYTTYKNSKTVNATKNELLSHDQSSSIHPLLNLKISKLLKSETKQQKMFDETEHRWRWIPISSFNLTFGR